MHKIPRFPRLDQPTALQAVANYQIVSRCGALGQLRDELAVAYREREQERVRQPIGADFYAQVIAQELARLIDYDPGELLTVARQYLMGDDRTTVALNTLHDLAERLRHEMHSQPRKGV